MDFLDKIAFKFFYPRLKKYFPDPVISEDTMPQSLRRTAARHPDIKTIFDVGAAQGTWTEKTLPVWPQAAFFLLEPLQEREPDLKALKAKYPNVHYRLAAVSDKPGTLQLTVGDDLDGSGFYGTGNLREVEVVNIDQLVKEHQLQAPFLIKLDTHGFEWPIIEGAKETLKNTKALIVEVYGYRLTPNSLLFWEFCQRMDELGFRLADMVETMRRPYDNTFWQADFVFMQKNEPSFSYENYR